MKYKLRFITMHEDQGGGFQGNKEETEDEEAPQAHYFGYLCNFATLQWYQLNDEDVEEVEEKIVFQDAQDKAYMLHYICCGSDEYNVCYQEDKSLCSYTKNLPWQYQQLPLSNHLPLHLPPYHQKHQKETIQKGSLASERMC